MIRVHYRRSKVFDSMVKVPTEIEDALKEIENINSYFRSQPQIPLNMVDKIREAGPKALRRTDLQQKVRAFLQDKLGPDFMVIGWGDGGITEETTFRGDCRVRSDPGHERPKRKRKPYEGDLGGSD